jgi:hypothetical protein
MADIRWPWRRSLWRWLLLGLLAGLGCGPRVAKVEGTLFLNGGPLPDIEVYFIPDGERGTRGPRAAAITDSAGHFQLDLGDLGRGAVVGHHRVVLIDRSSLPPVPDPRFDGPGARPRMPQPSRIPAAYTTATTTPLRAEVPSSPQSIQLEINTP